MANVFRLSLLPIVSRLEKETFKAVILFSDLGPSTGAATQASNEASAAAESLAADLVRSLTGLVDTAQADAPLGPEWTSIWSELLKHGEGFDVEAERPFLRGEQEDILNDAFERKLEEAESFFQIKNKWVHIGMTSLCTLCAGHAAGLMGLISIEPLEMAIKLRSGERFVSCFVSLILEKCHSKCISIFSYEFY